MKNKELDCIELAIGVDGLPIVKSSESCLWPILGRVVNIPGNNTFLIGMYHGNEKPMDANDYMSDFIDEMVDSHKMESLLKSSSIKQL